MKKALIVASIFPFICGFEKSRIELLIDMGYSVSIASNLKLFNDICNIDILDGVIEKKYHVNFSRSPLSKDTLIAYNQIRKIIKYGYFDIIHCHTPVAGILTRLAARRQRKNGTKVLYTAHGFHFYKGAPLKNWILYYPVEKFCSKLTDGLITINQEDYSLACRKFKAKKKYYVPGVGLDVQQFKQAQTDRSKKRGELNLTAEDIVILSVGELNKNKNHQIIIRALAKINNPNIHYVIAGAGDLKANLKKLSMELGLENNVHLLGYRNDVCELYSISDIFCLPSYREGLSVALMEAMASGLPCVVSRIRGNVDLIKENENGLTVKPDDETGFQKAFTEITENSSLKEKMGQNNKNKIEIYSLKNVLDEMGKIYKDNLNNEF